MNSKTKIDIYILYEAYFNNFLSKIETERSRARVVKPSVLPKKPSAPRSFRFLNRVLCLRNRAICLETESFA